MNNQFSLLRDSRFLPMFTAMFLGAFNNTLFKQTLSVMVAYRVIDSGALSPQILVSLAAGLFVVPLVLFTPLAGALADKYDKARVMRVLKLAEIFIVMLAVAAMFIKSVGFLLLVLFLLGTQAAFFSPAKFSILPQHLAKQELIGGNALLNTGTYFAVLLGTILGGLLALDLWGNALVAALLFSCAVVGLAASFAIPPAPARMPDVRISLNVFAGARDIFSYIRAETAIFPALMGCAWFFFTGALLLAQFPNYTRQVLGVDNVVMTFFMVVFSVGVGLGGLLNNRLLHSRVEATFVPVSVLGIGIFAGDLYFSSAVYGGLPVILNGNDMMGIVPFFSHAEGWRVVFDLFMLSLCGGLYVVPLKSIIQDRTPPEYSARVLAGSSMTDAAFVLLSALVAAGFYAIGAQTHHLFIVIALGSFIMAVYTLRMTAHASLWAAVRAFGGRFHE